MWVAIDCCSKNWVAVLKSLKSTDLDHTHLTKFTTQNRMSRRISITCASYYGGSRLKSRLGDQVSWLTIFMLFPSTFRQMRGTTSN
jgi:hypothetical protein